MTPSGDVRRLVRYARTTVRPHSAHYRVILANGPIKALADIPTTELASVQDPAALVLRPDVRSLTRGGHLWLAARTAIARVSGGFHRFNQRVVEEQFKPVHWVVAGDVPLGYSSDDLRQLAAAGEAWLDRAGVGREDVVVSLLRPGPSVAYWQLVLGCRRARISALHLPPGAGEPHAFSPSVLVGEPDDLVTLLAEGMPPNLRTIVSVGHPDDGAYVRSFAPGVAVVAAWAPVGVRALWSECRAGGGAGFHAWAQDVVEVGPGDELLWTGVRWKGSAVLRLRTGWRAVIDRAPCPACGASTPRIRPLPESPDEVLGRDPDVSSWEIERRGPDDLIVTLRTLRTDAPVGAVVRRLDRRLHATQFIVPTGPNRGPGRRVSAR